MRHKHADLIIAWAEGATIEYLHEGEWWQTDRPQWHEDMEYRIKPGSEVQEPEPVAWMWQSDNYATRFSQRIFELFDEADDMRNRHGGNLYPLSFVTSPQCQAD